VNLSKTVDKVMELHLQTASPEKSVVEYLKSVLWTTDAHVDIQSFGFSLNRQAWIGGTVFVLSIILLVSIIRRKHRVACLSALAIPLILFVELSLDIPVVSWPILKTSESIIVDFPVQDAASHVIVGTGIVQDQYGEAGMRASGRFEETVVTFLLPMTLVIAIIGLWQILIYFGKLDFEDAHTIMLIMGSVCLIYYALLLGVYSNMARTAEASYKQKHNAASIALLAALAEDLSNKYPRLENTWVTVAFIGSGPDSRGAKMLARRIKRNRKLPTYFIGCERIGSGGAHAYVIPDDVRTDPLFVDRTLIRVFNGVSAEIMGRHLEIAPGTVTDSKGFVDYEIPSITITTLSQEERKTPAGGSEPGHVDRGQLLLSLQLIESALSKFDDTQSL
jgi:hypothetical protein